MTLRVLGVDPGLTRCGIGVLDSVRARGASLVDVGVIRTGHDSTIDRRLLVISEGLTEVIERHRPDVVAIERVFSQSNTSTVMGTAHVSGVAILLAAQRGIPVALHTPSEVKAAVTGDGRAGKEQVQSALVRVLGLSAPPRPADAADALAVALTHLWRSPGAVRGTAATNTRTSAQDVWARAERDRRRAKERSNTRF